MAEPLNLDAGLVDKFSKPLRDLRDRLKDVKPNAGMIATARQFEQLRRNVEAATRSIAGGVGGGMNAALNGLGFAGVSVGALGAAGAIATITASVRAFSDNAVRMRSFSNDTRIAMKTLKELQAVASGLGIDPGAVQSGLAFSAHNVDALRRGQGNYADIASLRGGGVSIANDLRNSKTNDEAVNKELDYLAKQRSPEARRKLAGLFFGDEEFAEFGSGGKAALDRRRAAARDVVPEISAEDAKRAEAFNDSIAKVSASFEKLQQAVGTTLAPNLTAAADAAAKFSTEHAKDVQDFFQKVSESLSSHDWAKDMAAAESFFGSIQKLAEWLVTAGEKLDSINKGVTAAGKAVGDAIGEGPYEAGKALHDRIIGAFPLSPTPPPAPSLNPGGGIVETPQPENNGLFNRMAYHPDAKNDVRSAILSLKDSLGVAAIALGVEKGMRAFADDMTGNSGADGVGGSAGGFQNAAFNVPSGARAGLRGMAKVSGAVDAMSVSRSAQQALAATGNNGEVARYIAEKAKELGINPQIALAVANHEGLRGYDPTKPDHGGDGGSSFGPFQLHYKGMNRAMPNAGLGDEFTRATGHDARSPSTWKAQVDFALKWASKHGWSAWMGAAAAGIYGKTGIGAATPRAPLPSASKAQDAARASGAQGPHGKVSVEITSKDHPVKAKHDDSPIFQELKINRGNRLDI